MPDTCYIGLMSGTSMDGIDAVAVIFNGDAPPQVLAHSHNHYSSELQSALRTIILPGWEGELPYLMELDYRTGNAFAAAAQAVIKKLSSNIQVAAIGMHGQTIYHLPDGATPSSWQMGNPAVVSELTGVTTIADWRRRDMAAGGQGAPLTPAFHRHFLNSANGQPVCILNLGGIANITVLDGSNSYRGFDTGPANTLMDYWISKRQSLPFDNAGGWAATGEVNKKLLESMLADDYFRLPPPKSTGLEYFNAEWLRPHLQQTPDINDADIQRTLLELTARSVADTVKTLRSVPAALYLCGGGAHNTLLHERLQQLLEDIEVTTTARAGIDPDLVEAIAFAWFSQETLSGRRIEVANATGATGNRMLGAIYPA